MASERVQKIVDDFNRVDERVKVLMKQVEDREDQIELATKDVERLTKSRWIVAEVQKQTQEKFKERVERLVTMAMRSVFTNRQYGFELIFEQVRNQMEVQPVIYEIVNGQKEILDDPEFDVGEGLIDVISIALKVVFWSLEKPRSRPVIILDEPGKNTGDLIVLFGEILRRISHDLKFQLIIITHENELIDIADRSYHIKHDGIESKVILVKGGKK